MNPGVIFFCHGARQSSWREPFEAILTAFRQRSPQTPAALAFLELMTPDFLTAAESLVGLGVTRIRVIPLFLAPGGHTRDDLPALVALARDRWPDRVWMIEPTLTELAVIRQAIVDAAVREVRSAAEIGRQQPRHD